MTWFSGLSGLNGLNAPGLERRPLVFVEDHLYHTTELLAALSAARPDLLSHVTICGVDRPGPDTAATVAEWLRQYPELQVVAPLEPASRLRPLTPDELADASSLARVIARLVRPGGILVQDVQLGTLPFIPADRWWESIYLAATVRGLFAEQPPTVRFLSNKRGYAATFGRDLMDAGFDPRDVMDKSEIASVVVPALASLFDRAFPLVLDVIAPPSIRRAWPTAGHEEARREIVAAIDLVIWPRTDVIDLAGRLVGDGTPEACVTLRAGSHEAATWQALVEDRLRGGDGLAVVSVGERIGPAEAERAELTNLAARHIHTLRSRLTDPSAIVTARHAYRLSDKISVARVRAGPPAAFALRRPSDEGR